MTATTGRRGPHRTDTDPIESVQTRNREWWDKVGMAFTSFIWGIATLLLTPARFSLATGHARSSLARRAITASGKPIPWFTYPAIDLLTQADVSQRRVLEFGAGQSTKWWVNAGAIVRSLESDPVWFRYVGEAVGSQCDLRLVSDGLDDFPVDFAQDAYDVVVIDGLKRQQAVRIAMPLVAPGGCIIQDNSEGFWSADPGRYEIVELLHGSGFQRVDFYGFVPGVWRRHCTSIYFRERCFLFEGDRAPTRLD